jgi:replicative DNA helicase
LVNGTGNTAFSFYHMEDLPPNQKLKFVIEHNKRLLSQIESLENENIYLTDRYNKIKNQDAEKQRQIDKFKEIGLAIPKSQIIKTIKEFVRKKGLNEEMNEYLKQTINKNKG